MAAPNTGRVDDGVALGRWPSHFALGRWPSHFALSHLEGCVEVGTRSDSHTKQVGDKIGSGSRVLEFGMGKRAVETVETVETVYQCLEGCPVRMLDEQSGVTASGDGPSRRAGVGFQGSANSNDVVVDRRAANSGGASRFFFTAKPHGSEKNAGLGALPSRSRAELTNRTEGSAGVNHARAGAGSKKGAANAHPTVKPLSLMRWLVRLITPPGGVLLDPFAGSGTTLVAALDEGMSVVGCELGGDDGSYVPILVGRVRHALAIE